MSTRSNTIRAIMLMPEYLKNRVLIGVVDALYLDNAPDGPRDLVGDSTSWDPDTLNQVAQVLVDAKLHPDENMDSLPTGEQSSAVTNTPQP